jgi:hypothetical protein
LWQFSFAVSTEIARRLRPAAGNGAFAFQLLLAGNVLSALVHAVFIAGLCCVLLAQPRLQAFGGHAPTPRQCLPQLCCAAKPPQSHCGNTVWDTRSPLGGLFQLLYDPQCWEKAEHGLARTTRLAE